MRVGSTVENSWFEVFSTTKGTVYQSDEKNCLYLDFGHTLAKFDFHELRRLKNACERIDVDQILLNTDNAAIEIISLCACEHIYVLSVLEIIALKELLEGTFAMFQLNHIINDCLYRLVS